jgi:hypothetical protein
MKSQKPKPFKPTSKKLRCAQKLRAKGKMTPRRFKAFKGAAKQSRLPFI